MQGSDVRAISDLVRQDSAFVADLMNEIGKVIVGQSEMIERILIGLLTGGHVLLEGVPGLAKTLTVNAMARVLDVQFQRIQFTPDLLPADIIGTMIYNPDTREFAPKKGPILSNLVLADEVNRAPAKVQSALLEAMQEHQVTIGDITYELPEPFLVMATQNPIEQEGTYPLPEAQVDRFMLMIKVGYPSRSEERTIMDRMTEGDFVRSKPDQKKTVGPLDSLKPVADWKMLRRARDTIHQIYMEDKLKDYILDVILATRRPQDYGLPNLADLIEFGASPRASIYLNLAARAHAFLQNRGWVMPDDIKAIGPDVLRHRVILSYEAEAEELTSEDIIQQIFEVIEVP